MRFLNFIFIFCFSFLFVNSMSGKGYQRSQLDNVSNRVIVETARKICEKYHLQPAGMGGGAPSGKIESLGAWFSRKGKKLNVEESRRLIVCIVQDFLEAINKDEELRPFLRDYPFTANNLGIMIISYDEKGQKIYDPYIGSMFANEGRISYSSNDPDDEYNYKFTKREKYDEALSILKHQQEEGSRK